MSTEPSENSAGAPAAADTPYLNSVVDEVKKDLSPVLSDVYTRITAVEKKVKANPVTSTLVHDAALYGASYLTLLATHASPGNVWDALLALVAPLVSQGLRSVGSAT